MAESPLNLAKITALQAIIVTLITAVASIVTTLATTGYFNDVSSLDNSCQSSLESAKRQIQEFEQNQSDVLLLKYNCYNTKGHEYINEQWQVTIPKSKKEVEVVDNIHSGKWACVIILHPDGSFQPKIYSHNGTEGRIGRLSRSELSKIDYLTYRFEVSKANDQTN